MRHIHLKFKKSYLIRLYSGEDILVSITKFVKNTPQLKTGIIQGIGAVSKIKIGYYTGNKYNEILLDENLEILSLLGNVVENAIVHLHGIFGKSNGSTVGGHILEGCTISFTGEIYISSFEPSVNRKIDSETKLNLLDLPNEYS